MVIPGTQLGSLEITQSDLDECKNDCQKGSVIVEKLNIKNRYGTCYLTAWNFKDQIVTESKLKGSRIWESFGKRMWIAPLRNGMSMSDLVNYQ